MPFCGQTCLFWQCSQTALKPNCVVTVVLSKFRLNAFVTQILITKITKSSWIEYFLKENPLIKVIPPLIRLNVWKMVYWQIALLGGKLFWVLFNQIIGNVT